MRSESLGKLSFDSQHLERFINIFLAIHIATDSEGYVDRWTRSDGVGLGKEDFVPVDEVARNVIDMILAGHDPAVRTVFPHIVLPIGLP